MARAAHYGIDAGSAGPLRGAKGTVWEGGLRVPAIMRWPGKIPPGRVTSEIAANIDIYPTFAELAGAELPDDRVTDGRNLWPLLEGGGEPPREDFYYYEGEVFYHAEDGAPVNKPVLRGVRHRRWKLFLESPEGGGPALYDLLSDVGEKKNVAAKHPDIVGRLRAKALSFDENLRRHSRPLGRLSDTAK